MIDIKIPMPFLVTVDDVGWWNGQDGSALNQPFRTGINRGHCLADYQALIALGEKLHMRIPAGFVMCEWDRTGLLRHLPSATWMGEQWRGCPENTALKEQAADLIKTSGDFIEPAVHGIGHEFWENDRLSRSEFHDRSGTMRPSDEVKKHLEYFFRLMDQYGLNTSLRLFIPPALNHSFGNGEKGFQGMARDFGIQYITLRFDRAKCHAQPQFPNIGWEDGIMVMDRGKSDISWNRTAPEPEVDFGRPIIPLHWANILDKNPENNMDVVHAWATFITREARKRQALQARDISVCLTQYLNQTQSTVQHQGNRVVVHMDWIAKVPRQALSDAVFFSVNTPPGLELAIAGATPQKPATPGEARFLKLELPESGKIVFQCRHKI